MEDMHNYCCYNDLSGLKNQIAAKRFDIRRTDILGNTVLHIACWWGNVSIVECLMGEGCDQNAINLKGQTPYDLACQAGHMEVMRYLGKIKKRNRKRSLWQRLRDYFISL